MTWDLRVACHLAQLIVVQVSISAFQLVLFFVHSTRPEFPSDFDIGYKRAKEEENVLHGCSANSVS